MNAPLPPRRGPDPELAAELATFLHTHPDPFDWMRAHRLTCAGDPDRRVTRLPLIHHRWAQRRHLSVDVEELPLPAKRWPRLVHGSRRSA